MATITLRLDDAIKEELEVLARGRGQSLSDLIRWALDELLLRNGQATHPDMRPEISPLSLTVVERQQLALLHRILARVVGEDNDVDGDKDYQLDRAKVIEEGFVGEYYKEFIGILPELGPRDSGFVLDVLDLFRIVTHSLNKLTADKIEVDADLRRALRFDGFDENDPIEGHMLAYARYLVLDQGRWTELQGTFSMSNDRGNSHSRRAAVYQRMLAEHAKIKAEGRLDRGRPEDLLLGVEDLRRLAAAQIHPDRRG
ncbi:YfbU family protein [Dactylosporangium cerinum]|uniref:YfbU family protein n=1 Tax=Dactylosporangium cerinum TaxID=1434730 RepID=A0ABV9WJ53_9ACTN